MPKKLMEESWAFCIAFILTSTLKANIAIAEETACLSQLLRAQEIPHKSNKRIMSFLLSQIWGEVGRKGEMKMFVSFTIFKESVGFFSFKMTFRKSVHINCFCLKK